MAEISVIVPTYNEEKIIARTLTHINRQSLPRQQYEVIVVDGGSKDRTRDIAKKYADKVILQRSKAVGGARNDGVEEAAGRIVVHTDADVVVPKDWLQNILSLFDDGVVAVCGPDTPLETSAKYQFLYFGINLFSAVSYRLGIVGTRGTNTAVLREKFRQVGGYTDYPLCDDVELGLRLKKIGKIVYSNRVKVSASTRRFEKMGVRGVLNGWLKGDLALLSGKRTQGNYHRQSY